MVEATLKPGGGGIMDMALAARGDFLAFSGVDSTRTAGGEDAVVFKGSEGALDLVEADLVADVTVLVTGFADAGFLVGSAFLATGFLTVVLVFFVGTAFLTDTVFLVGVAFFAVVTFLADTAFLAATGFLAGTAFFLTAGFLATTAFFEAADFFTDTTFLTVTGFLAEAVFFAGTFNALALGFATATLVLPLALLLALLSLECFVDFNANLLTGWRRVPKHQAPYCFWLLSRTSCVTRGKACRTISPQANSARIVLSLRTVAALA